MFRNLFKMLKNIVCIFFLYFAFGFEFVKAKYTYDIKTINLPVDHFDFTKNETFNLRYLYNNSFGDSNKNYPILFYTGNEGDIEMFAQNSGFMWETAAKFNACVVFAEHRYYGKSLPFGDNTFNNKTSNLGYLSVEQTLEDYVELITYLNFNKSHPVIAFGGSYGGMLSAWLRMKFPNVVDGALAASAPIWQFKGLTQCDIFYKIATSVFTTAYSSNCSTNIKNSWKMFRNFSVTEQGRAHFNKKLLLCNPITTIDEMDRFLDYLEDVYTTLAMVNYPYDNQFLATLPAYPVRQFCFHLKDIFYNDMDLLNSMVQALSVYTNYTGQLKCLDYKSAWSSNLGDYVWSIQQCNQMVMPLCSNGTMFRNKKWNFQSYSNICFKKFGIRPKENDIIWRYGGKHINNGLLDPWSGGGVLQTTNKDINVIIIPEGAHHLDLRESNPSDPISVQHARMKEREIISGWIQNN